MLINIQFLRFAAAMLVVIYHAAAHMGDAGSPPLGLFAIGEAVGFAGVDVFFVISGFIMWHTTSDAAGPAEASLFIRRRVARIYSGYWPFFLLAIPLFAWAYPPHLESSDLPRSAFLWPTPWLLVAVAWTLVFEMYFYLLFTLLVLAPPARRLAILLGAFAVLAAWTAHAFLVRGAYEPGSLEFISISEYYMLSPYMGEFFAGSLAAWWLKHRPTGLAWTWLVAGCAMFGVAGWVNTTVYGSTIEMGYTVMQRVLWFGPASLMIVVGLVRLEHAGRVAPLRFSLLAGGASYAIYLSHTLILTATQKLGFNAMLRGEPGWVLQLAFTALSIVILAYSIAHYRTLERWLHHRFRALLGCRTGPTPRPLPRDVGSSAR